MLISRTNDLSYLSMLEDRELVEVAHYHPSAALCGLMAERIAEQRRDIEREFKDEISDLEHSLSEIEGERDELQRENDELQQTIEKLELELAEAEAGEDQ